MPSWQILIGSTRKKLLIVCRHYDEISRYITHQDTIKGNTFLVISTLSFIQSKQQL